ncbi:unnamed protein product [Nippostrongylus brasiliensis]|uniref:Rad21_Rec8 domain-containing protein n=1 Tax=Nippostrongylus brasiliensis TaxID=27835 RepID=A0A0N4XSA8_NIPBR|nr:unnamed protein product [Nippostrongylus brasiliensis]
MVRSESADEEMAVSDKYDVVVAGNDDDDDDFSPQPIWHNGNGGTPSEAGKGNTMPPARCVLNVSFFTAVSIYYDSFLTSLLSCRQKLGSALVEEFHVGLVKP